MLSLFGSVDLNAADTGVQLKPAPLSKNGSRRLRVPGAKEGVAS